MTNKADKPKPPPGSWALALGRGHYAFVDIEDIMSIITKRWFVEKRPGGTYYASRTKQENGVRRKIYMHREIMGESLMDREIDHINGNGLDNRKENLRVAFHGIERIKSGLQESVIATV
jgi:hypothetical protein